MTTSITGRNGKTHIRLWAVAFWLSAWQLGSMALGQELLLASPASALSRLWALLPTAEFWLAVGTSSSRILGGFLLGCLLSGACAALAARFLRFRELLAVPVAVVKAVPVASFILLAFLWLPSKDELALLISFLMVFPVLYANLLTGILETDPSLLEMARVFRVPLSRRLRGILLPQVLPYFRTAASLGLGLCWKAGVAAEVIGVVRHSMGEQLYNAKIYFETPDLFAWTAAIVGVSLLFEKGFLLGVDALVRKAGG